MMTKRKNNFFENLENSISLYEKDLIRLIDSADIEISTLKPSEWAETYRKMSSDLTAVEGMFDYSNSPYSKEIINCLSPDEPVDTVFVMKGAQIGFSAGVIENGIGYIISNNPGNTLLLVGHEDNMKDTINKIENVIDGSGIRHMIKSNIKRARNVKSGDTDTRKDFSGGYLKIGLTNHKSLRNMTMVNGFIDDFEAMKGATDEAGSTVKMVEQRFAAMAKRKKLFFISTPELKETSNIEPGYLDGDQRKFHIPCPCCGDKIKIEWEIPSEKHPDKMAGIKWEIDLNGDLITESVGYECYKCGGFFDDRDKMEWLNAGEWIATSKPIRPGLRSYHISALYAPVYMDGWEKYVRDYIECTPIGRDRNEREESQYKTFVNVCLGLTYEFKGKPVKANKIQRNIRKYEVGTIPEKLSISDGNGRIVMLTCAADLNGVEDDGRLDYEIVAYSESGASYSIDEGSIGTFIRRDKNPHERKQYTYKLGVKNSIWPIFEQIIKKKYLTDTGRVFPVFATGLDVGHLPHYGYTFADNINKHNIFCLKGSPREFVKDNGDYKTYRKSVETGRGNLYLVESNHTKDLLAEDMDLNWSPEFSEQQPFGFMNFPTPSNGKYTFPSFFSHFEAETKMMESNGRFVWKKINDNNHKWDCRLYNNVVRDILLDVFFKSQNIKNGVWKDYCDHIVRRKK